MSSQDEPVLQTGFIGRQNQQLWGSMKGLKSGGACGPMKGPTPQSSMPCQMTSNGPMTTDMNCMNPMPGQQPGMVSVCLVFDGFPRPNWYQLAFQ